MTINKPNFDHSDYDRPDPYVQNEWNVSSSQRSRGERQLSLRSKRRIFTLSVTAFTAGLLVILFQSPYRNEFIAPGALASSHAQILAGQGGNRCSACHPDSNKSFSHWLSTMFQPTSSAKNCQSDLCLKCHQDQIPGEFAKQPHNLNPNDLAQTTRRIQQIAFSQPVFKASKRGQGSLECNTCHREHHGEADLAALTDQQCQTCHANDFHSFESGHPEFSGWPVRRRSRIAFDHATHAQKYFPEHAEAFDCKSCHVDDTAKNVKRLVPFENACARCHSSAIDENLNDGLVLFSLPMLDLEAIKDAGSDVGQWPVEASGDFDGPLNPLTKFLISIDEKTCNALNYLGPNFEFGDVDPDNEDQVRNVVEVAWSIKYLLFDLASEGKETIRKRLEILTGREITPAQLESLVVGLDTNFLHATADFWFPKLHAEVAAHRLGSTALKIGWTPGDILARYQSPDDELLVPNPLRDLIRPTASNQENEPTPPLVPPHSQIPLESTPIEKTPGSVKNDSDLLAKNPIRPLLAGGTPETMADSASDLVPSSLDEPVNLNRAPVENQNDTTEITTRLEEKPSQHWSRGSWVRDDRFGLIRYQPRGHADECLQSWMNLVASIPDSNLDFRSSDLFEYLIAPGGVGKCVRCHTVDQEASGTFQINWQTQYRDHEVSAFTRFSHGPHTIQPLLEDCSQCHELDQQRTIKDDFAGFDPSIPVSNFRPLKKSDCTGCHQKGRTASGCTDCHNYHVGSRWMKK